MKLIKVVLLSLCIFSVHAELLVVKKGENGFMPLDASDEANKAAIANVLLKYEWPMVITNTSLTKEEQDELLTSGESYAEEKFISKKLKEINQNYDAIFIPTSIYELFIVFLTFKTTDQNPLRQAMEMLLFAQYNAINVINKWKISLAEIIDSGDSPGKVRSKINDVYRNANALFYDGSSNACSYINQELTAVLFAKYAELAKKSDAFALSNAIKDRSYEFASVLIKEIIQLFHKPLYLPYIVASWSPIRECPTRLASDLSKEHENKIIAKAIALEYEARDSNRGLLFRGTSFSDFQVYGIGGSAKKQVLIGNTLHRWEQFRDTVREEWVPLTFEQAYKRKENAPYSVSFGNSLFGGVLRDCEASAYTNLSNSTILYSSLGNLNIKTSGYALLIDKKEYVLHNNSNLFFIAPLSPIASLFQYGEWFHSRTKAAVAIKNPNGTFIVGLFGMTLKDQTGVILITRDPLKHAELFSKFLVEYGRLIQKGDESDLSDQEKKFLNEVCSSQAQAAEYYKAIRTLEPFAVKTSKKIRQNILEKTKQKELLKIENAKKKATRKLEEQQKKSEDAEFSMQQLNV